MPEKQELDAQIISLSALLLAVETIEMLANKGRCDVQALPTLLPSLLRYNQNKTIDYFDDFSELEYGRKMLLAMLNRQLEPQTMRYVLQLINVEKKLSKNQRLMGVLKRRLDKVQEQVDYFSLTHENVLASFADIYSATASQATGKIMVVGEPSMLQQQNIINKIRTLLLCGVRACSLWRVYGGSRWQLVLARGAMVTRVSEMSFE